VEWKDVLVQRSDAIIADFIRTHPDYSVDPEQPDYRGGTNCATMAHRGSEAIVFKYFDAPDRYRNELFCLRHFAATELAPAVLDVVPEKLIAMTRLRSDGRALQSLDRSTVKSVSREIGDALAKFMSVPLIRPAEGYWPVTDYTPIVWGKSPRESIMIYLDISRSVQSTLAEFRTPFFTESLRLIEAHVDVIAAQREVLWHEDIGNLMVCDGGFTGFYDFEMCRGGTEAMQLGVALGLCFHHTSWPDLLDAYEQRAERKLDTRGLLSVLAMQHFYHWIRVCRWGGWDGNSGQREHCEAAIEGREHFRQAMIAGCRLMQEYVDVRAWFKSPELA
jgi:hypothetical protein